VAIHALDWYESSFGPVDGILLLQPTSPFRTVENTKQAISLFEFFEGRTVLGLSPSKPSSLWKPQFIQSSQFLERILTTNLDQRISNQNISFYVPNGLIYLSSPRNLRLRESFFDGEIVPVHPLSPIEQLDIDTAKDWELAELILQIKDNVNPDQKLYREILQRLSL
jgi:CMP-N-acetylneuraminic acid synthetase